MLGMDIFDQATEHEAQYRDAAISVARAAAAYNGPPPCMVDGVPCCASCLEPIPAARLAAVPGVGLCVECAEDYDG